MPSTEPLLTEHAIAAALHERERLQEIADLRLTAGDVRDLLQDLCGGLAQPPLDL